MTLPVNDYDELHVISDLHLGGRPGFQIFGSTGELAWLIDYLRQCPADRRIALLINGDFVDFLAQSPALPFDPEGAIDKLTAIANDDTFRPIFDALRRFAGQDNRYLVVNLGNHDLELALPWVREAIVNLLSGGNPAARGRITLATDGAGIALRIGSSRVLCVHGNEVDTWNVADHEQIRRIGRDYTQGRPVEEWVPNSGSQLVAEVMNPIKKDYPFIDLLKPELPAVFPTLIALKPSVVGQLAKLGPTVTRLAWDSVRRATGFLDADPLAGTPDAASQAAAPVAGGPSLRVLRQQRLDLARDLLDRTENHWRDDSTPFDLVTADQRGEYVGILGAIGKLVTGQGTQEALRDALDGLDDDRTFGSDEEDGTYRDLDQMIGSEIDFLIAGHTHLERALKRRRGRGYYFNSGTWARLIQIPAELRRDAAKFAELFERMKAGTMAALDGIPPQQSVTLRRNSVVSVWREGGSTTAELRRVAAAAGGAFALQPVAGTRYSLT